ncbi:MAG: hypothetical protein ACE366_26795 [Bradymonadia bacterium]
MRIVERRWNRLLIASLSLTLFACGGDDDDGGGEAGSGGEAMGGAGGEAMGGTPEGGAGGGLDEAAFVARAVAYQDEGFTQINSERRMSQHGGDMVDYWVSNDIVDVYRGIDPEATEGDFDIPAGAMLVKPQFNADGDPTALTVMAKVGEGFDNGAEDWWWARIENDGTASFTGQVDFCINCHQPRANIAWLFGVSADNQR